jgi:hypothetical protein
MEQLIDGATAGIPRERSDSAVIPSERSESRDLHLRDSCAHDENEPHVGRQRIGTAHSLRQAREADTAQLCAKRR